MRNVEWIQHHVIVGVVVVKSVVLVHSARSEYDDVGQKRNVWKA